jgi:hypothetical protein
MAGYWRILAVGALAGVAILGAGLFSAESAVVVADEALSVPAAPQKIKAKLKQFDAMAREVDCQTKGKGKEAGEVEVGYEAANNSLQYTITLSGAEPNADYLLDVAECSGKDRLARGDGGHVRTDASGNGTLTGIWQINMANAKHVKASILRYCPSTEEATPPTVPCGSSGFSIDALKPPGR